MVVWERVRRASLLSPWVLMAAACPLRATNDQSVVINEVCVTPPTGSEKFVEILNRGSATVDTTNWWLCDHPSSTYYRLLQTPQNSGPAMAPGILLAPGDYLVIRIHPQFPPPNGDYTARPNNSGTTTHILRLFIPSPAVPYLLRADRGNFSIWDFTPPGDPDNPYFFAGQFMRDYVEWGPSGYETNLQRGCVASDPTALLWPPPVSGDCITGTPTPVFVAVNSAQFPSGSGLSINYNGDSANNPADYFVAPATEGERNVMPGDIDGDLHMTQADYSAFQACLGQQASTCAAADLDQSGVVDCADWPLFTADWQRYSTNPTPRAPLACMNCTRGDMNGDGLVDGADIPGFIFVVTGADSDLQHSCAADTDRSGQIDDNDLPAFVQLLLGAPTL